MNFKWTWLIFVLGTVWWLAASPQSVSKSGPPAQVDWRSHVIDAMTGGDGTVMAVDVNNDHKLDVVVNLNGPGVAHTEYVWYENPTWEKHVIIDGKPGNNTQEHCAY